MAVLRQKGNNMKIERCHLFGGEPYIAEKDGKYHVLQGSLTADEIQKWHDTENEAIEKWNSRVKAAYRYEKSRMGIARDVHKELGDMVSVIRG